MAADEVARLDFFEIGLDAGAEVLDAATGNARAAGVEHATGWRVGGARDVAAQTHAHALAAVDGGHRRDEGLGIGVGRAVEDGLA